MEYLGNVLTDKGFQVSGDNFLKLLCKQKANPIRFAKLPCFGTIFFKVIPNFAIIGSPLWDLTKSNAKWKKALLKRMLSKQYKCS